MRTPVTHYHLLSIWGIPLTAALPTLDLGHAGYSISLILKLNDAKSKRPESTDPGLAFRKNFEVYIFRRRMYVNVPSKPLPRSRMLLGSGVDSWNEPWKLAPLGSPPLKKIFRKNGSPLVR